MRESIAVASSLLNWFAGRGHQRAHGDDAHSDGVHHSHVHGVLDPAIAATARGIWAVKWSFVVLALAAALQLAVVAASGSVALLADAIHNIADATTAVPLWIAFVFARRKANSRFTYGYGRVEDLAGAVIVMVIFSSVVVAMWQAVTRLLHPHPVSHLGALAIAGIVGFAGNEIAAILRIRVGREMSSAALIADGYHARADGITSLAVIVGAAGVWFGFPLADPIVGLLIAATIVVVVWQSAGAVFSRLLDGVEPNVINEMHHAGEHIEGIIEVVGARARWIGHQLDAEADLVVEAGLSVREGVELADRFRAEVTQHLPALVSLHVAVTEKQKTRVATETERRTA
jgi:cation diffusion facilitator family transporter